MMKTAWFQQDMILVQLPNTKNLVTKQASFIVLIILFYHSRIEPTDSRQ